MVPWTGPAYNTMSLKKNVLTRSVVNIAKLIINIVDMVIVLDKNLDPIKLFGCNISIGGVFMYSIIDQLLAA